MTDLRLWKRKEKGDMGKGYDFEHYIATIFRDHFPQEEGNDTYRVPTSGSAPFATISRGKNQIMSGDIVSKLFNDKVKLLIECKSRTPKNNQGRSFPLEKAHLDKNRDRSMREGMLSVVAVKFKHQPKNSKEFKQYSFYGEDSNSVHYVIPEKHFFKLLKMINESDRTLVLEVPVTP